MQENTNHLVQHVQIVHILARLAMGLIIAAMSVGMVQREEKYLKLFRIKLRKVIILGEEKGTVLLQDIEKKDYVNANMGIMKKIKSVYLVNYLVHSVNRKLFVLQYVINNYLNIII